MITETDYKTGLTGEQRAYIESDYLDYVKAAGGGLPFSLPFLFASVKTAAELGESAAQLRLWTDHAAQERLQFPESDGDRRRRVEFGLLDRFKRDKVLPQSARDKAATALPGVVRIHDPAPFAAAKSAELLHRLGTAAADEMTMLLAMASTAVHCLVDSAGFAVPARAGSPGLFHIRTGMAVPHVQVHEALHLLEGPGWAKEDLPREDMWVNEGATERIALLVLAGAKLPPAGESYPEERAKLDALMKKIKWTDAQLFGAYFHDSTEFLRLVAANR